jgi:PAS domain S-box-containing protein
MKNKPPSGYNALREDAERELASNPAGTGAELKDLDTKRLLHELQVYQVELEMQNEQLHLIIEEKNEHEAHLRNIIKMTPAGYFRLDTDERFVDVNDAWLHMHGYSSPEEVVGKHFSLVQVDSGSKSALKHLAELKRGLAIPLGEFSSRRKDGSVGHHKFSAHPVVHVGRIVGFEWFIIDISDRIRVEEEKLLIERQLQQSQKLESLGVLAGGIAHDFNNILAVIMCYCDLAKQKPQMAGEFMPEIEKAVDRAAGLCRQMLAYAGKTQFVQSNVDVTALVDDIIIMLKSTLPQNAAIKPYLTGDLPCIEGDASQLRQIVMNLIINASEAIGEAQGEIVVSLTKTAVIAGQSDKDHLGKIIPAGLYLCLEVSDNGCGMDDGTKQRIFEPFYTTKFVGRGLGMSAVLGIITSHKGALQFSSHLGQGTTFKVYFPVHISESAEIELPQQATPSSWQGTGTILLVEDEPQLVTVAKALLETLGFSVIIASNGIEAIEQYRKNAAEIRLVVTDIGMPLMDGYELTSELKKLDPALPIIVSSGFGDTIVSSRATPGDIAGLISKPYSFEQLRDVLKGVVEGKDGFFIPLETDTKQLR